VANTLYLWFREMSGTHKVFAGRMRPACRVPGFGPRWTSLLTQLKIKKEFYWIDCDIGPALLKTVLNTTTSIRRLDVRYDDLVKSSWKVYILTLTWKEI